MVIAPCAYMLNPFIKSLREHGIPFHNPFQKSNGWWNPLNEQGSELPATRRVYDFVLPQVEIIGDAAKPWTYSTLDSWAGCLRSGVILKNGAKTHIHKLAKAHPHTVVSVGELEAWIPEEKHQQGVVEGNVRWLQKSCTKTWERKLAFALRIADVQGFPALTDEPRLVVGTIHSVKGGEADVVYLFPDLSKAGWNELTNSVKGEMAIRRMFYVGITRAKERLVLCSPYSGRAMDI